MLFLPFLAIIMQNGQRTVRERPEYSMTVLSTGSARVDFPCQFINYLNWRYPAKFKKEQKNCFPVKKK